ncbi:MAG: hypothetical protein R3D57_07050 [Hyphomicrobiaceae bacterium]
METPAPAGPEAAVSVEDGAVAKAAVGLLGVSLGSLVLSAILDPVAPIPAGRAALALAVAPFVLAATWPSLQVLARRLVTGDPAEMLGLTLASPALAVTVRLVRWGVLAGAAVLLLLLGRASLVSSQDLSIAIGAAGAMLGEGAQAQSSAFAVLGLGCAVAGMAAWPWHVPPGLAPDLGEHVAIRRMLDVVIGTGLVGGALIVAFGLAPSLGLRIGFACLLLSAQLLPALLALLAVPWLEGRSIAEGIWLGSFSMLALVGGGMADGTSAALAGVVLNLLWSVAGSLVGHRTGVEQRARLQAGLPHGLGRLNRPEIVMALVAWVFLVIGPGWPVLSAAMGGEAGAMLAGWTTAAAGLAGLLVRTGRAN